MPLAFEWDAHKAKINFRKHGISFDEACTIFDDPLAVIFPDEDHSIEEAREIILGHSILRRMLIVCFTEASRERIRIFSARRANAMTMKSTPKSESKRREAFRSPQPEYRFDYTKARPNRFAGRGAKKPIVVLLDPDVAKVFKSADSVNAALRAILAAVPARRTPKA